MNPKTHILGYPRIGPKREYKFAIEKFWRKEISASDLQETLSTIKNNNWLSQKEAGLDLLTSNDFSLYDQVLDTAIMLGCIPERYAGIKDELELYFALARGNAEHSVVALEMTKWFDTNYHYLVPEIARQQKFALNAKKPLAEFKAAQALGIQSKPVILGPVSFLAMSKTDAEGFNRFVLLSDLLPLYEDLLKQLASAGAEYIQIDEPYLGMDWDINLERAYAKFLTELTVPTGCKIILASYFSDLKDKALNYICKPDTCWNFLHLDLKRGQNSLKKVLAHLPVSKGLSLGLVDGRNIWLNDLEDSTSQAKEVIAQLGAERVMLSSSCSLLHVPVSLSEESELDPQIKAWLSFAEEKVGELVTIQDLCSESPSEKAQSKLAQNKTNLQARKSSPLVNNTAAQKALQEAEGRDTQRPESFAERIAAQKQKLNLPLYPTTTIGSFPQTKEVRELRNKFKREELSLADYETEIKRLTEEAIRWQEEVNIDVLVHGEFERNDMVEYFGQFLTGFTTTLLGWVQSYGSRCVKPPIIYGDISRVKPMTIEMASYAQSLTDRPVKGMLTGPVTILQWSFVRDDQARSLTSRQIALALAEEVNDLVQAGISVIQIDEPALREGLPLRREHWPAYLAWATDAFRLSCCQVPPAVQIHTHMCYAEFNDIIEQIAQMDADVITIETSRSQMELLNAFERFAYPNQIGPGVYDVHSQRIPSVEEMVELLAKASLVLPKTNIWVNPDCGLKTRSWDEVKPALQNMVAAACALREKVLAPRS